MAIVLPSCPEGGWLFPASCPKGGWLVLPDIWLLSVVSCQLSGWLSVVYCQLSGQFICCVLPDRAAEC
jgi:hypothetical protein